MRKIVLLLVLVFLGIGSTWAQSLPVQDAGSQLGEIIDIQVTGNNKLPVVFKKYTHDDITIRFRTKEFIQGYKIKMYTIIQGVTIPIPDLNTSQITGLVTPFQAGSEHTFLLRLFTPQEAPSISFVLYIVMEDLRGIPIIAFKIPAEIVK